MTTNTHPRRPSSARPIDNRDLELLVAGKHHDPHSLLGPHLYQGAVTVRTLKPLAATVVVQMADGTLVKLAHELDGVWVGVLPTAVVEDYRLRVVYGDGIEHVIDDPYRFLPTLGEIDLHLISEGRHEQLWNVLGAHVREYDGPMGSVAGTSFAVWAPNARAIRLVGDFNQWDGTAHPMRSLGSSGLWELSSRGWVKATGTSSRSSAPMAPAGPRRTRWPGQQRSPPRRPRW